MVKSRFWGMTSSVMLLTLLLTQYQNCASNSPNDSVQNVRVVRELSTQKVAFVTTKVEIRDAAREVGIDGLCAQSESVDWSLFDKAAQVFESGAAACEAGSFRIHLKKIAGLPCGTTFRLKTVAAADASNEGVEVTKVCPPLMARQTSVSVDGKDLCYLELNNAPPVDAAAVGSTSPVLCESACYRSDVLILRRSVDEGQCRDLQPSHS